MKAPEQPGVKEAGELMDFAKKHAQLLQEAQELDLARFKKMLEAQSRLVETACGEFMQVSGTGGPVFKDEKGVLTEPNAASFLQQGVNAMKDRAASRDNPGAASRDNPGDRAASRDNPGERSMARTVAAFNALSGQALTEEEGWAFMVCLKEARALGGNKTVDDDYIDGAAYFALQGECAVRESSRRGEPDASSEVTLHEEILKDGHHVRFKRDPESAVEQGSIVLMKDGSFNIQPAALVEDFPFRDAARVWLDEERAREEAGKLLIQVGDLVDYQTRPWCFLERGGVVRMVEGSLYIESKDPAALFLLMDCHHVQPSEKQAEG